MRKLLTLGLLVAILTSSHSEVKVRQIGEGGKPEKAGSNSEQGFLEFKKREKEIVKSLKNQGVTEVHQIVIRIDQEKKMVAFFKRFLNLENNSGSEFIRSKIFDEIPSKEILLEMANQLGPQNLSSGFVVSNQWRYYYSQRVPTWTQKQIWGRSESIFIEPIFVKFDEHPAINLLNMAFKKFHTYAVDTRDVRQAKFYASLLEELENAQETYIPPKLENAKPFENCVFKLEKGRLIKEVEGYDASNRLVSYTVNRYTQKITTGLLSRMPNELKWLLGIFVTSLVGYIILGFFEKRREKLSWDIG